MDKASEYDKITNYDDYQCSYKKQYTKAIKKQIEYLKSSPMPYNPSLYEVFAFLDKSKFVEPEFDEFSNVSVYVLNKDEYEDNDDYEDEEDDYAFEFSGQDVLTYILHLREQIRQLKLSNAKTPKKTVKKAPAKKKSKSKSKKVKQFTAKELFPEKAPVTAKSIKNKEAALFEKFPPVEKPSEPTKGDMLDLS